MSTWLYLRCDAHTPPLYSEDVGQHLYDLPTIRGYIADRDRLATEGTLLYDGTPESHFDTHARHFLRKHPTCPLSVEDEYGQEHPTEGETDE